MSGQIFICYRRDDSAGWSGRLSDRLKNHFPSSQIFMDVDTLDPGVDFVEAVEEVVGACDVLIAVIGSRWLNSSDRRGKRRLDIPEDLVRLEIATALKRGIRVIPVLVDGASMPRSGDLPDELKSLIRLQALKVSQDRFRSDSEPLITAVDQALKEARAERRKRGLTSPGKRTWLSVAGVVTVLALGVVAVILYFACQRSEAKPAISEPMARPSVSASTPVAVITPNPSPKPTTPEVVVQPSPQSTSPVAVVTPSPEITATPTAPATGSPSQAVIATPTKETQARTALQAATKDHPWVNSLGMKFVPVAGTQVLFSVWDTRVEDFETFVTSVGYNVDPNWNNPGFSQGPTYPVVWVSWNDAEEFCRWLTKRERSAGDLPQDREYRLPKDEEWSAAVGLKNEVGNTPEEKSGKIKLYPWGTEWPPPNGAGNYSGEESKVRTSDFIKGYKDDYVYSSPVGSFAANQFGLYDMGGNVWQWCEDWYNAQSQYRVLRGASWTNYYPDLLLASFRNLYTPDFRGDDFGFRCVVAVESSR